MTTPSKAWCLGAAAAINGLLSLSLAYTWVSIYRQNSYPIDFFLPIERTEVRATIGLCVAAISVPLAIVVYARIQRDLPPSGRIATLIMTGAAGFVALAFASWRYLR